MSTPKILVGCDPEVFVKKDGVFKSAFGLIPGDKKNPHKVRRGAVQVDGMALEFNIDAASTEDEFCINVQDVFDQMCKMVPGYAVVASPVAHFSHEYMKKQPAAALELGCDPDYNGWTGVVNDKPDGDRPMRTAAGHIHIGWTEKQSIDDPMHSNRAMAAARQLDYYLGLPSVFYDNDVERREMYGKAGCLRVKPYGMEYRTLSNAWLNSEKLMRLVYRNAVEGIKQLMQGNALQDKYGDIQHIINTSDKKAAERILKKEGICYG
jgi:hypothetical protein